MRKCATRVPVIIVLFLVSGCATVTGGSKQSIEVSTEPQGATVEFSPSGDRITTPATIELDRSHDHVALITLEGYESVQVRVNRAPRGELYGNTFVPFAGIGMLMVDAASDAEFGLYPDPLDVHLTVENSNTNPIAGHVVEGPIIVFNRNTVAKEVYFSFDGAKPCKLKKWQMAQVELDSGPHQLNVYHWDLLKFSDNYEVEMPPGAKAIGVFSGVTSTNFSYYDELPTLKKDFTLISCEAVPPEEAEEETHGAAP